VFRETIIFPENLVRGFAKNRTKGIKSFKKIAKISTYTSKWNDVWDQIDATIMI
jgi:hypothetical protein